MLYMPHVKRHIRQRRWHLTMSECTALLVLGKKATAARPTSDTEKRTDGSDDEDDSPQAVATTPRYAA
jgi:hypothetical protein